MTVGSSRRPTRSNRSPGPSAAAAGPGGHSAQAAKQLHAHDQRTALGHREVASEAAAQQRLGPRAPAVQQQLEGEARADLAAQRHGAVPLAREGRACGEERQPHLLACSAEEGALVALATRHTLQLLPASWRLPLQASASDPETAGLSSLGLHGPGCQEGSLVGVAKGIQRVRCDIARKDCLGCAAGLARLGGLGGGQRRPRNRRHELGRVG
mmetsp:Transcript_54532/g.174908  ORF Transcript_54532/g.174908 Transcript_54532/m.174908 type:complete len:212 (-) Transcript_54532:155-790(-)